MRRRLVEKIGNDTTNIVFVFFFKQKNLFFVCVNLNLCLQVQRPPRDFCEATEAEAEEEN